MCAPSAGGGSVVAHALAVGRQRRGDRDEVAERLQDPERLRLRMASRLADVVHRRHGHARGDERVEQLRRLPPLRPLLQQCEQRRPVRDPVRVREEAGVGGELGHSEDVAQRGEELVVAGDDHELAVAGREDLVRRDLRERASLATRHGAGAEKADELVREQRERRLVERDLERAAGAGALALVQRGDHAERRPDPGAEVDQRHADAHRRPVVLAGDAHDPRRGLQQRVVARLVAQRAARAERADRAVDEPRVARSAASSGPKPCLLGRARPEALDEHVRAVGEPEQRPRGPRGSPRSTASERLPAFEARNIAPSPSTNGRPQARAWSPASGSTLTTSAPSAASSCVAVGPAREEVTSTTRVPASGRSFVIARWSRGRAGPAARPPRPVRSARRASPQRGKTARFRAGSAR